MKQITSVYDSIDSEISIEQATKDSVILTISNEDGFVGNVFASEIEELAKRGGFDE